MVSTSPFHLGHASILPLQNFADARDDAITDWKMSLEFGDDGF
jgi:hypothetical protein